MRFLLLCCLWCCPLGLFAQIRIDPDAKPLVITPEQRTAAAKAILKLFDEGYVFPEKASDVRKTIEAKLSDKEYEAITTGQALAEKLTSDIVAITKDKHVRVRCSTEKLPVSGRRPEPSAAERKQMQEEMRSRNAGFVKVERLPGNVGYLRLDGFMQPEAGKEPLAASMQFLKNTDALIIDLRYNGGGTPMMVRDVCSYFFDEHPVLLNRMFFRQGNRTEEFYTHPTVPGPKYLNKEVYVLTSAFTFSGAEECAYNFQTQKRATIVGETTGGGAHPGGMMPVADHYLIFIPNGRAVNPITNTNWEGVGVKPEVEAGAEKALETAHQLAIKKLMSSKDEAVSRRVKDDVEQHERMSKRVEELRQKALKERAGK
jgi:retinol-binding protein 3